MKTTPAEFDEWGSDGRTTQPGRGSVKAVLDAVSAAPGSPLGKGPWNQIRPPRIAARSTILFLETPGPVHGRTRWVVKRANPEWSQDDIAGPALARQEFYALTRLQAHFEQVGGRVRVAEPLVLFPGVEAFAMEYVSGRPLSRLLRYRSFVQPGPLREGIAGAAEFIRQVHSLDSFASRPVNLRTEAEAVLLMADEKLQPLGLALPRRVTRVLSQVPSLVVDARQVWLHGDFGPTNIMLADDGSVVGIDAALDVVGAPEEDLARFVTTMSGTLRFAPEIILPPIGWGRRRLESQLLTSYYGSTSYPPLFELRLMYQLVRRWPRLRQLAHRRARRPLLPFRLRVVGAQMCLLMEESSRRLAQSLGD